MYLDPGTATFLTFDYRGLYRPVLTKIAKEKPGILPYQSHPEFALSKSCTRPNQRQRNLAKFSTVTSLVYLPRVYPFLGGVINIGPSQGPNHTSPPQVRRADTPSRISCSLFCASRTPPVTPYPPNLHSVPLLGASQRLHDVVLSTPMNGPRYRIVCSYTATRIPIHSRRLLPRRRRLELSGLSFKSRRRSRVRLTGPRIRYSVFVSSLSGRVPVLGLAP